MIASLILGIISLAAGIADFIASLIAFISSYFVEFDGWGTDVSADGDYLVLTLLGLALIGIGIHQIYCYAKKDEGGIYTMPLFLSIPSLISAIYSLARMIKLANKGQNYDIYRIWFAISLTLLIAFIVLYAIFRVGKKEKEEK